MINKHEHYLILKCKKNIVLLFLVIVSFNFCYGQGIKLIGNLYDTENNQTIAYANISVLNMPIGTCTNSYGDFVLNLADSLFQGSLEISCIGYNSRSFPIDSLRKADTLKIGMLPHTYNLEDIVVVPGQNDAKAILKKVIARIDNNYTRKKYYLDTFFRHRVYNKQDTDKTSRLTEAAISIHKNHYSDNNNKIQVQKIRNSNNYVALSNSIGKKLLHNVLGGDQNPIHRTLDSEKMAQKKWIKNLLKSKNYEVSINEVSFYDNSLVYIIEFKLKYYTFLFKKYPTTHTYKKYSYYINAEDSAILKVVRTTISHNPLSQPFVKNDSIEGEWGVVYTKFENKYYMKYAFYYGMIPDRVDIVDDDNFYKDETELLVNHLAVRRKDYDRIKHRNQVHEDKTLWDMEYEYDLEYWDSYNLLLDKPLNPTYIKDLEFEEPLEQQFKNKDVESRN